MKLLSKNNGLVDYIFWIVLILFTNPGGILEAMGEDSGDGGVNVKDLLFMILFLCFTLIYFRRERQKTYLYYGIAKFLVLFMLYHFIVYVYFTPIFKGGNYSLSFLVIKNRHEFISFALFFITFEFFLRSYRIFFEVLVYSSIIVIILFIITVITGYEILPIEKLNRDFVNIDRILLVEYGLMPILIPMGTVLIASKISLPNRKLILIGYFLMCLTWLLSLTRRHIFGTMIYLVIALMMNNYFLKQTLLPFKKVFTVLMYLSILVMFLYFSFPKYIEAGGAAIDQTFYVLEHGETTTGRKDVRLGFGKDIMQNLIKENYIFGTGFDNRWRTAEGDTAGYETADYPFLAAIAMKGILGILIFLPIYIYIIKSMIFNFKFIRRNRIDFNSIEFFMLFLFTLYFFYDLMQYMNWFSPVSQTKNYLWYILLSMYVASNQIFYKNNKRDSII